MCLLYKCINGFVIYKESKASLQQWFANYYNQQLFSSSGKHWFALFDRNGCRRLRSLGWGQDSQIVEGCNYIIA